MSCYILTKKHIDTLVTAICSGGNRLKQVYHNGFNVSVEEEDIVGQILMDEMYKSVNHRYEGNSTIEKEPVPEYKHRLQAHYGPMGIVKACKCYAYQSCEHPDWDKSLAKKIIDTLEYKYVQIILDMNGYEDQPWGIDDWEANEPEMVDIMSMMRG